MAPIRESIKHLKSDLSGQLLVLINNIVVVSEASIHVEVNGSLPRMTDWSFGTSVWAWLKCKQNTSNLELSCRVATGIFQKCRTSAARKTPARHQGNAQGIQRGNLARLLSSPSGVDFDPAALNTVSSFVTLSKQNLTHTQVPQEHKNSVLKAPTILCIPRAILPKAIVSTIQTPTNPMKRNEVFTKLHWGSLHKNGNKLKRYLQDMQFF